jgi:hypothetical protein
VTFDTATDSADENDPIRPGRDGPVITADGDLAHLQLSAEYSIVDLVAMLKQIGADRTDALVRSALQRSVVQTLEIYTSAEFSRTM